MALTKRLLLTLIFAAVAVPLFFLNAQNFRPLSGEVATEEIQENITHVPMEANAKIEAKIDAKIEMEVTSYKPFNATGPCGYLDDPLVDLPMPNDINHAFSMVVTRNKPIPRPYLMGLETFFKHNPNMTLYVYGDIGEIDPRFVQGGFKMVLVP